MESAKAIMALQLAQQAKMQGTLTSTREETVKDFLQDWLQYRVQPRVRPRTFLTYQDQVNKHLLPSLGHIKLQRLTAMYVQKLYHQKQQDGLSAQMIVQIHKVLRMALNDAIMLNHLSHNICQAVQIPRPSRKSEMHPLTAEQARRFKTGSAWVRQDLIFCSPQGKPLDAANLLSRSFRPLLTKVGLDRIRFHDLRHTTATLLLTMGTHPKVVQELLGHSRISMTLDLYSHVIPSLQEETMQRFSIYLTSQ